VASGFICLFSVISAAITFVGHTFSLHTTDVLERMSGERRRRFLRESFGSTEEIEPITENIRLWLEFFKPKPFLSSITNSSISLSLSALL